MNPRLSMALVSLSLLCLSATFVLADCPELILQPKDNAVSYLGLHPSGGQYGAGQMIPLVCDYRLEVVSFLVYWGDYFKNIRALTTGDSLFCDIRRHDHSLIATTHTLIPDVSGSETLDFDFTSQNILLLTGDYLITCYTREEAWGELPYCSSCTLDGDLYTNSETSNPDTWQQATNGDAAFTLFLDSGVTPVEATAWDRVKACYR